MAAPNRKRSHSKISVIGCAEVAPCIESTGAVRSIGFRYLLGVDRGPLVRRSSRGVREGAIIPVASMGGHASKESHEESVGDSVEISRIS